MCGIIGVAATEPVASGEWLAIGCEALRHRGPDAGGEWWSEDSRVGLAHRRLAIIDLSESGNQPMHGAGGDLVVVFNGEIYNYLELRSELSSWGYSFKSSSDTEVVIAAYAKWGMDCLSHFNGMFALALYDASQRRLFLARDRAGEKPLFYWCANGELRFASELKGLLADSSLPREISKEALDCYLGMGYIPGDRCILEGFHKLPPAHALEFKIDTGETKIWRYWRQPASPVDGDESHDEQGLIEELERLLGDAVQRQLVADVPLGVLLSGGVDSSLVTALAARNGGKLRTFTVSFPGDPKYNEATHAKLIAQHFATEHLELEAKAASAELLPTLARQFDEPMCDSSMIPTYLVSELVRQHCAVALGWSLSSYKTHNGSTSRF